MSPAQRNTSKATIYGILSGCHLYLPLPTINLRFNSSVCAFQCQMYPWKCHMSVKSFNSLVTIQWGACLKR